MLLVITINEAGGTICLTACIEGESLVCMRECIKEVTEREFESSLHVHLV